MEELLKQARDALKECSDDLAALVEEEYSPTKDEWPVQSRRYQRDIEPVNIARALLPKLDAALSQPRDAGEGLAILVEREACAKIAESMRDIYNEDDHNHMSNACNGVAIGIRARAASPSLSTPKEDKSR